MQVQKPDLQVLSGIIRNLKVENTTADVFFRPGDREGMAATGVVAAAMGLSGIAAGMASTSMEEMQEPICKASFDLDGKRVDALLWNWPFKEGDAVQVVAESSGDGYIGFAVLDPKERVIALYPHVSAGGKAHWKNVIKLSSAVGAIAAIIGGILGSISLYAVGDESILGSLPFLALCMVVVVGLFFWIGYRIGRRFTNFTKMAEWMFLALGWKDVGNINLRKVTKVKRKPDDPPAMGDSYFRY